MSGVIYSSETVSPDSFESGAKKQSLKKFCAKLKWWGLLFESARCSSSLSVSRSVQSASVMYWFNTARLVNYGPQLRPQTQICLIFLHLEGHSMKQRNISNTSWYKHAMPLLFIQIGAPAIWITPKVAACVNIDYPPSKSLFLLLNGLFPEIAPQCGNNHNQKGALGKNNLMGSSAIVTVIASLIVFPLILSDLEALSKEEELSGLHILQSHGPARHAVPPVWERM